MVQVQNNTSPTNHSTDISSPTAEISRAELWQNTLTTWKSIAKKIPKNHAAWRVLSEVYQDFIGADFDKEKGILLLAEFAKAVKEFQLQYPDYQLFTKSSIYQKLSRVWQNLSQEYDWQVPEQVLQPSYAVATDKGHSSCHHFDPACFNFALAGAEVYAQKYLNISIKEKDQKTLLKNELAQYFKESWLLYLPKRGLKNKISEDFFWHFDDLSSYFFQLENTHHKHNAFPATLTWGRLAQIRQATWQSLQATLFSPISAEQQNLIRLQKSQFTMLFSDAVGDFTNEFQFLANQSIWIGLLPKNYFQSTAYQTTQNEWTSYFTAIYQWNLADCEQAWVFALRTASQAKPTLHIKQYDCPKLQSPLSWLALKNILEGEPQNVLEEAQNIVYTPRPKTTLSENNLPTYPLLRQESLFGTMGEGIFTHSFEGIALPKEQILWAASTENLQKTVVECLTTHSKQISKQMLFGENLSIFNAEYVAIVGLCPFQTAKFYADPRCWAEGAKLEKVFNPLDSQVFIHLALHQGELSVFASNYPVSRNFMGRTLSLARQRYEKNGEVKDNLSLEAIGFFKEHYESQWQEKAENLKWALQTLLNLSILEDCQVEPELALEMRVLAQLSENIPFAKQLFESIYQPNPTTFNNFKSLKEIFLRTKRSFEQLGKKQSRGKESYDTLKNYFEEGTEAIRILEEFIEEAQRKEINLEREITAQAIFEYTYATLHLLAPNTTTKLKDLHIPLHQDFWAWVEAGASLLQLHLQPEETHTRPLKIQEKYLRKGVKQLKVKFLVAENSLLLQDKHIEWHITQIPTEIFEFYLGNQPALQWAIQALPAQFEPQEEYSFLEKYPEATQQYLQKHIRWIVETVRTKKQLEM